MDDQSRNNLRASTLNEDLQQDRRLIMRKIQNRRRSQKLMEKRGGGGDGSSGGGADAKGGGKDSSCRASDRTGVTDASDSYELEDDVYLSGDNGDDDVDYGAFRDSSMSMSDYNREDERLLGERPGDGAEEGLEAMTQALTSPPVAWWGMRKQWQKRRGDVMNFFGGVSVAGGGAGLGDEEDPDASCRSGVLWADPDGGAGVVGHPVMLEDPVSMGYDAASFRRNPYATVDRKRRTPKVIIVPRDVLQKRQMQQTMYIVGALCVCFLFMFFLEQRKLGNYAMVESPMSLSAYLAGEQLLAQAERDKNKVTLGDLGLEKFDGAGGVPQVEFGTIEVDPNDPLLANNPELAEDPLVGNDAVAAAAAAEGFNHIHGMERFEMLKGVVVGWGVTPSETFENHNSAQYKALSWMAHEDVLRYAPENDHWIKKIVQRYALATIYYATGGPEWKYPLFFLSSHDECNWNRMSKKFFTGVGHCEGGYITVLALWGNGLKGALPPEVGALTTLRTFSVFENELALPPPISLNKLTSLTRLYIQRNKFKADISYLCPSPAKEFKADCGKRGGVGCPCCTACGFSAKNDRANMIMGFT